MAIGNKGFGFLNRIGAKVVSHATQLGDTPHLDKLIGPVKVLLDAYQEGKLDAVYLVLHQVHQHDEAGADGGAVAAAVAATSMTGRQGSARWDYIYEPDAQTRDRRTAGALCRGAGVPGRGREHGVRAVGAHGGDEVGQPTTPAT